MVLFATFGTNWVPTAFILVMPKLLTFKTPQRIRHINLKGYIQITYFDDIEDANDVKTFKNEHFEIRSMDMEQSTDIMFKIIDASIELDFFKVLFLSVIMG